MEKSFGLKLMLGYVNDGTDFSLSQQIQLNSVLLKFSFSGHLYTVYKQLTS